MLTKFLLLNAISQPISKRAIRLLHDFPPDLRLHLWKLLEIAPEDSEFVVARCQNLKRLPGDETKSFAQWPIGVIQLYARLLRFGKEGFNPGPQDLFFRGKMLEGYSMREIAELTGRSLINVRSHYYRGLERLRRSVLPEKSRSK